VRSRLGHLLADAGGGVQGVAVLGCAPGERHELGLMMAAIAMRRDGWRIVYLGADTPLHDAVALAQKLSARVLGITIAMDERAADLEHALRSTTLPPGLTVVLGGAAANRTLARRLDAMYAGQELAGAVETLRSATA
jgi:methanogenic corrinoid protein MtbC1